MKAETIINEKMAETMVQDKLNADKAAETGSGRTASVIVSRKERFKYLRQSSD